MTYQSEVLADSPWGYWQELETTGTTLADSSPNGRPLTTFNSPTLGKAGPFAGASAVEYAGAANARAGVTVSTSDATVELWVYLSAYPSAQTPLFGCTNDFTTGSAYDKYLTVGTDGRLRWQINPGTNTNVYSPAPLALNTWHHVVASAGAAGAKLRINANTVASSTIVGSYTGAMYPCLHWGLASMSPAPTGSGDYSGQGTVRIAEPAFYTTQLSDARASAHYIAGESDYRAQVLYDGPSVYWKLDDRGLIDAQGGPDWVIGSGLVSGRPGLVADGGTAMHSSGSDAIGRRSPYPANLSGSSVSFSAWVNIPSTAVSGAFFTIGANTTNGWGVGVGGTSFDNTGKQLILLHESVAWKTTGYNFTTGIHHVVVTRSSADLFTAYVDGASVWSGTFTPVAPTGGMAIGGTSTTARALSSTVDIDDATWFTSELTASTVTALYNAGSGSASATAAASPTLWLKLDGSPTGTTTAIDASGNGRNAAHASSVQVGQASLLGDGSGAAALYDGSSAYTTLASAAWMDTATISVECRYKPRSADLSGNKPLVTRWLAAGTSAFLLWVSNGKVQAYVYTTAQQGPCTGSTTLVAGQTYTIGMSYDGANLQVYVNGQLDGTLAVTGNLAAVNGTVQPPPIEIARASGATLGGGTIDEVSVTPTALSAARFAARHNAAIASSMPATPTVTGTAPVSVGSSSAAANITTVTTGTAPVSVGSSSASAGLASGTAPVSVASSSSAQVVGGPLVATGTAPVSVASSASALLVTQATGSGPVTVGSSSAAVSLTTGTAPVGVSSSSSSNLITVSAATGSAPVGVGSSSSAASLATVTGTAPVTVGSSSITSAVASIEAGVGLEVGAVTIVNLVMLAGVDIPVGTGFSNGEAFPVVPLSGVSIGLGSSLAGRTDVAVATDPRRQGPQWRYVITDLAGTPLGELDDIEHAPVQDGVNLETTMQFTMAANDPARQLIEADPMARKCQVWEGDELLLWGPLLPDKETDPTVAGYTVHDPSWWWRGGRRVVGRLPRLNLLHNGDFTQGLTWWTRGYDPGSIPAAAPTVRVVHEDFMQDTDGVNPIQAAEIVGVQSVTQASLASNAVFWPNRPFASEALANGFRPGGTAAVDKVADAMPTTAGLAVTVIGHTANDGTGDGLQLSLRRAKAAAARIKAKRPGAVITTKGVGYYQPDPSQPVDSQAQRRVVIQYSQTITAQAKQYLRQSLVVTQPKDARYPLVLTLEAMLKVDDNWTVAGANMMALEIVVRRTDQLNKAQAWDTQKGVGQTSISDTDPVDRWLPLTAQATVPADGRAYQVDVYLYAPAALARYTAVGLYPEEELYFWGVDQALIVKGLLEHAQDTALGHGNLGIETRTPLTGILRDRTYPYRDHMSIETAVQEFGGLHKGLDYDTQMLPDGRVILSTFYPQQGKSTDYVLVLGGNVAAATPETTRDVASSIIMQAQNLGSYRAEAYARDAKALGGLLLERVVTAEQGTPLNELREAASQELAWGGTITTGYWLDIDTESIGEVLAHTQKGDVVRLILDEPLQVDRLARIITRQRHPDSLRLLVALEVV